MSLQDTDRKELQERGEDDSITWQTYAVENLAILESVIQDMVQQKGIPKQLFQMANSISKTLSCTNVIKTSTLSIYSYEWCFSFLSLKNCKKDFELLLGEASALVVALWQFNIKHNDMYGSLKWPPPKLKDLFRKLVEYEVSLSEWCMTFTHCL